jgi:lipoyl(octanoyl) transferase
MQQHIKSPQPHHEVWFGEHTAVYTIGQAGSIDHLLKTTQVPVVRSDRGGQITYHGPGQLMLYTLFDLKALQLGIRQWVRTLENILIDHLADHGLTGHQSDEAPGVYINDQKIASIGLRVRQGRTYHGMAINCAMDLTPFTHINPCGYSNLTMTQLSAHQAPCSVPQLALALVKKLANRLDLSWETAAWPVDCAHKG